MTESCAVCAYSREHGWFGDTIPAGHTHCRDCHATWSGAQVWGHCAACCNTFRGETAFDRHHQSRNCPPPADGFRVGGKTYARQTNAAGLTFYAEDQTQQDTTKAALPGRDAQAAESGPSRPPDTGTAKESTLCAAPSAQTQGRFFVGAATGQIVDRNGTAHR